MDDEPSDLLFACVDPLLRVIEARRDRWESHVKKEHEEIAPHVDAVQETLEAPDHIVADARNPDGLNYYRFGVLPTPYTHLYLKVVVSFHRVRLGGDGEVVTAYATTKKIAKGEVHQWR